MNRRDFGRMLMAGGAIGAALAPAVSSADSRVVGNVAGNVVSAAKQRAKKLFHGFENTIRPAFTPNFSGLDADGIRHDVRQSIRHGVFSMFTAMAELTAAEREQFFVIARDEAGGKVALSTMLLDDNIDEQLLRLREAQAAGCTHVLVHPPFNWAPKNADELFDYYWRIADSTELDIVLWATDGNNLRHLHPSNVVLEVLDRVADLPNVVALKVMSNLNPVTIFDCFERLGDRLLINCVDLRMMPLLIKNYDVQWSGAWTIEALQSPDQPYVNDYFRLLRAGQYKDASALYWRIQPAYEALMQLMAPMLPLGVHPAVHLKYYQWCVGGNGGLPREPRHPVERKFPLTPDQRGAIRNAFRSIGIEPQGSEESFVTGRAAYARGVRSQDVAPNLMYVA